MKKHEINGKRRFPGGIHVKECFTLPFQPHSFWTDHDARTMTMKEDKG